MTMARLRVRSGASEVEIDSRDFYVDNQTIGEVIDLLSSHLPGATIKSTLKPSIPNVLDGLDELEAHEPEFSNPIMIKISEIREKIALLKSSAFFDEVRTASETVEQLREHGWIVNLLDVSKELAKMSAESIIYVNMRNRRNYYSTIPIPLVN